VIITMLIGLMNSLWSRFMGWIIGAGILIAAVGAVFIKGRSSGKRVYREKHERLNQKAAERTAKIKDSVSMAADDDIAKRLEKHYRD